MVEGFSEEVLTALRLLTHDKSEPYMDYVARIKGNPLATAVKLADLRHNSDLSRLSVVDDKALDRVNKYAKAIKFLEDVDYSNEADKEIVDSPTQNLT